MSYLEKQLIKERLAEMDRYGRSQTYSELRDLLPEKQKNILDLINHGMAIVDDAIDSYEISSEYLNKLKKIFQRSFSGEIASLSTTEEKIVSDLGHQLCDLSSSKFPKITEKAIGKHTYEEVLRFWGLEEINLQRRWKILDRKKLDEINYGIGSLVASQFLFILCPPSNPYYFISLAKAYGVAVKSADNICDYRDDIAKGFINIAKEDIFALRGVCIKEDKVVSVNVEELGLDQEYIQDLYKKIMQKFESASNLLLKERLKNPIWKTNTDKRLYLFKKFCESWLYQLEQFISIETDNRTNIF